MAEFQVVFRGANGDLSEMLDDKAIGAPHVAGALLIDGNVLEIRGAEWLAAREDKEGVVRFVCTPVEEFPRS